MQTRKPVEQQLKHNDCGITVIKIIYNLHNIVVDRKFIEENIHLTEGGSSLEDIKDFFEKQQFLTEYNLMDLNSLKTNAKKSDDFTPGILPIRNNQGQHFVVIKNITSKKVEILDPSKGQSYKWTFSELSKNAITATANYDWISHKELIGQIIKDELSAYNLCTEEVSQVDKADMMNKLTYFSYIKENFGFSNVDAEKSFLKDLILNEDINLLPKQFRSLKINQGKLKIKTPVVLTIKKAFSDQDKDTDTHAPEKANSYTRLAGELKHYRKVWTVYIIATLFAALLLQITVFTNQILIDNILPSSNISLVFLFAIGFGLFRLFNLFLSAYKNFIAISLANILDNFFLSSFIAKLNTYPIRFIHNYSRGDLTERIKDSLLLKTFFIRFFTRILIDAFIGIYSLSILFIIKWEISLVLVAFLSLFIFWFSFITPYIRENEKRRFLEKSNLFSSIFENIDGLQAIKSFCLESLFMQRLAPKINNILNIQKRVRFITLINSAVIEFIIIVVSILIIVLLSRNAIYYQTISTGQIITFLALSSQIFSSISNLLDENLDLQENGIILSRYFDFSKNEDKLENQNQCNKIKDFQIETIQFSNVSFYYIAHKAVFESMNFLIEKGDKIKLEGGNGAGKSTLCKILSFLYPVDGGDILINNEKQFFYNKSILRKKILLVSNEDILFNDTIGFNISFDHKTNTSDLLKLSKEVGLSDFISEKEEGFEFIIYEQGRNLSTGQRKKILLMRAFFSNAELIIYDETFSGIDKESRIKIEDFINADLHRSYIIISHEPLHHLNFSKTLIMQDGRIEQLQY